MAIQSGHLVKHDDDLGAYTVSVSQNVTTTTLTASSAPALVTGSITGTSLSVRSVTTGALAVGQLITGPGVLPGTVITGLGSGTTGGPGTYTVNVTQSVNSATLTAITGATPAPTLVTGSITSSVLNVVSVSSGAVSAGQAISGTNYPGVVLSGSAGGGAGAYNIVTFSQNVGSQPLTLSALFQLGTIVDNFGNTVSFSWLYNSAVDGEPLAITGASIANAGGPTYSISYNYSTIAQGSGVNYPDLLTKVVWLDGSQVARDSTSYQYTNPNYTYALTAILDSNLLQRWGVSYDSNGLATTSSLTGATNAVDAYNVAYTPVAAPGQMFTRTVTNPLGKQSIYTYLNNATQGLQLMSIANQASPHSPASTRSYQYGSDSFLSQITDENNTVETLTHDPRGMPAQTIEASGTSLARTTTTTWDPAWKEPDTIVQPNLLTTTYKYNAAGAPYLKKEVDQTNFPTPYPTNGRAKTWNYAWNSSGQLTKIHGPLWVTGGTVDTTTFGYNANGYLKTIAKARNAPKTAALRGVPSPACAKKRKTIGQMALAAWRPMLSTDQGRRSGREKTEKSA